MGSSPDEVVPALAIRSKLKSIGVITDSDSEMLAPAPSSILTMLFRPDAEIVLTA
jgi:hypothetical protein